MTQTVFASNAHQIVIIAMEAEFALNVVKPHGLQDQHCIQL
jgi:hypothetical protein